VRRLENSRESIGAAIGRIPSGCAILTVEHEGQATGVLVSWVQQAAFEPLSITVAVKRGRPAGGLIDGAGGFLLNLIGEDPSAMFKHFAKGFAPGEDAFVGLEVEPTEFGPMILAGAAFLGCRVSQKVAVGDHDLYIAEVVAAGVQDGAKPYTHVRKTGLAY
jgi:flavin reductase (DIM6/NTAB) family NADH-FMN oxidoreductase RutF